MKADIKPVYKKDDPFGKTKVQFQVLFYSTFISAIFFFIEEDNATSYADDKTPWTNVKNTVTILGNIETKGKKVIN